MKPKSGMASEYTAAVEPSCEKEVTKGEAMPAVAQPLAAAAAARMVALLSSAMAAVGASTGLQPRLMLNMAMGAPVLVVIVTHNVAPPWRVAAPNVSKHSAARCEV